MEGVGAGVVDDWLGAGLGGVRLMGRLAGWNGWVVCCYLGTAWYVEILVY